MADKTVFQRFVSAWGVVDNPPLDCMNPHFKNRYASLKGTLTEIRKACVPNGLAYVQRLDEGEGGYVLSSYVTDGIDNLQLSSFPVATPPNPQAFGSELTYKKRQQAQADWGIVGEEDEDGQAAADASKKPSKSAEGQQAPKKQQDPKLAAKRRLNDALKAYCEKVGRTVEEEIGELGGKEFLGKQNVDWLNARAEFYENN